MKSDKILRLAALFLKASYDPDEAQRELLNKFPGLEKEIKRFREIIDNLDTIEDLLGSRRVNKIVNEAAEDVVVDAAHLFRKRRERNLIRVLVEQMIPPECRGYQYSGKREYTIKYPEFPDILQKLEPLIDKEPKVASIIAKLLIRFS